MTESIIIDRLFPGVGRIKRATGTHQKAVAGKIDRMLTALYEDGQIDYLIAVRDGQVTLLVLYSLYQRKALHELPTGGALADLAKSWTAWVADKECSEAHRRSLAQSLRHLRAPSGAPVAEIVQLLAAARVRLKDKPQSFRLLRGACQAFLRATLKGSHPLYVGVSDIPLLRIVRKQIRHPLTVPAFLDMVRQLPPDIAAMAWTMATTGMRVNEMYGSWRVQFDRVLIDGTKTKGARRLVPLVVPCVPPSVSYPVLRKALAKAGGVAPYDLRRTYAVWMEAAEIPRTRRKLYLGHLSDDITGLYEQHEIVEFLAVDAAKLRAHIEAGRQVLQIAK